MAIDKLTPQYLNQDDDERIIQPFEMVDALNIRVSHEEDGDAGVIKNVEGNSTVAAKSSSDTIPSTGLNKVIGAVSSEAYRAVYFFLYNGAGNHGIYKYTARPTSEGGDAYQKVYQSSDLNFGLKTYVSADIIVNQQGEHLLYFTDNRNEPRKINATKALSNIYPTEFNTGTAAQKELFLTVCKAPPVTAPTHEFKNNDAIERNQLSNKLFQFAYQYVYDDGEISALSPYSKIAVSPNHLAFNSAQRELFNGLNNEIEITVKCTVGPVEKIRVFAREGQTGFFHRIAEIDNNRSLDTETVVFRNDGLYSQLDEDSANKPFDAVPRKALAQTFSNSRLFYGNYLEGFDNLSRVSSIQYPVYNVDLLPSTIPSAPRTTYNTGPFFGDLVNTDTEYIQTGLAVGGLFENLSQGNLFEIPEIGQLPVPTGNFEDVQQSFSGKPVGFKIDTSEIPSAGLAVASKLLLSYTVSGDSIGIANISEYTTADVAHNYERNAFDIDIKLFKDNTVVSGAPDKISVLNPSSHSRRNSSGTYVGGVENRERVGSLNNLQIQGGFDINAEISVPAGTDKDGIIELIVGAMNALDPVVVGVRSTKTNSSDIELASLLGLTNTNHILSAVNTNSVLLGEDISNNVYQAHDETTNEFNSWIFIDWDGAFTMTSDAFYSASNDAVLVRFQTSQVDLVAVGAASGLVGLSQSHWSPANFTSGYVYTSTEVQCEIHTGDVSSNVGGHPFRDFDSSDTTYATTIRNMSVAGTGLLVPEDSDVNENKSFKTGATHEFGVVYYDHRNRSGGVQKLGSVDVVPFGNIKRGGRNGRTQIDLRIMHEPPEWATRWAPVYSSNTSYESFLQFTVSEALLPNLTLFRDILSPAGVDNVSGDDVSDSLANSRLINSSLGGDIRSAIFLSMRPLEGKNNSYKEFKGGELSYQYQEGDILRVVSYESPDGQTIFPQSKEFKITGYNYFVDDESNPLEVSRPSENTPEEAESEKKDDIYRRTGWFLSVRDNDHEGFKRGEVELGTDFFSQKCVIEILRPKKAVEEPVYYEIGESYPIVTVANRRTHGGDRVNTGISGLQCTVLNSNNFESAHRFYIGDKVVFHDSDDSQAEANGNGFAFVAGVAPLGNKFRYFVSSTNPFVPASFGLDFDSCSVDSAPDSSNGTFVGVVTLNDGDVYLKQREMLVNERSNYEPLATSVATRRYNPTSPRKQAYDIMHVESERASDFFDSSGKSLGRTHIETPDQEKITRYSSITYSDPLSFDSTQLHLSSFNPSKFPYKDMPAQYGGVTAIEDGNESLTVLQQSKVSFVPINRNVVKMGEDSSLVTSTDVMGTATFLAGSYGPGDCPEGVLNRFGVIYFSDPNSGVVCSVSSKGVLPISTAKMESYFEKTLCDLSNAVPRPRIPAGFDPENSELVITTEPIDFVKIVIDSVTIGYAEAAPAAADQDDVFVSPVFGNALLMRWDNDPLLWNESSAFSGTCIPKWDDAHQGVVYLDRINDVNGCYIHPEFQENQTNTALRVEVIDENRLYRGSAHLSLRDNSITFCDNVAETDADGGSQALSITSVVDPGNATIAWSPTSEKWLTFYSFVPEMYANIQNKFFSFKDGQMWFHNKNTARNNFYGTGYDSKIEIISKGNPSSVKGYKAISLEGDSKWKATLSNDKHRAAVIQADHFNEKEGMYYANVPRVNDDNVNNANEFELASSSFRVIGTVESVDGDNNKLTFTTFVNDSPVITGSGVLYRIRSTDTNWTAVGSGVKITGVDDRDTLNTNVSARDIIEPGDILANAYGSGVSGDMLRGYYAKVKLENNGSTPNELYAVNLVYDPSSLHNDGGQPNNQ